MQYPDFQRLQHILDYCKEIGKTISRYGNAFEIFDCDADFQRSIAFSILQIGELSGGLSQEFRQSTSSRIQWAPIKGMRNMVAHSYGNMNREIIWETATIDIPVLQQFCEEQVLEGQLYNALYSPSTGTANTEEQDAGWDMEP